MHLRGLLQKKSFPLALPNLKILLLLSHVCMNVCVVATQSLP